MLIGFELIRCLCDILESKVDYGDVLLIITTETIDFRNEEEWDLFWHRTVNPMNVAIVSKRHNLHLFHKTEVHNLIDDLIYDGKLAVRNRSYLLDNVSSLEHYWHDVIPTVEHMTPAVKDALDYFRMLDALCRVSK